MGMRTSRRTSGSLLAEDFDYGAFTNAVEELRRRFQGEELVVLLIDRSGSAQTLLRGDNATLLELLQGTIDRIYEAEVIEGPTLEL